MAERAEMISQSFFRGLLGHLILFSLYWPVQVTGSENTADLSADYVIRSWRTEQGLPDNTVSAIAQSSDGYIWIGTRSGLARIDGIACTVFSRKDNAAVTALGAGPIGSMWSSWSDGGLVEFRDGISARTIDASRAGTVHRLQILNDGSILIGGEKGLSKWSAGSGLELIADQTKIGIVRAFALGLSNSIQVASHKGLWRYEAGELAPLAAQGADIRAVAAAADGGIWLAGNDVGLMQIRDLGGTPRRVWQVSQVRTFCLSRGNEVWIGTTKGRLERLTSGGQSNGILETGAESIDEIFEDREGNLWLATDGAGAIQLRAKSLKVIRSRDGRNFAAQACSESPTGRLWLAGRNGQICAVTNGFPDPRLLSNDSGMFVESVLASRQGGLWLATRFDGLFFWPDAAARPEKRSATVAVSALFEDRVGRVWVASGRDGVMVWERTAWRPILNPDGEPFREVSAFAEDAQGEIWIALRQGRLAQSKEGTTQWIPLPEAGQINSLYADIEGNLWIGTRQGLLRWREGRATLLDRKRGLQNDDIQQIQEDFRGYLWLSSNRGIFRAKKAELLECADQKIPAFHSVSVGREEGLATVRGVGGHQPTSWKGNDGRLWFITSEGTIAVDPLRAASTEGEITAVVEELRVDNQLLLPDRAGSKSQVPAGYQHLSIHYTAPTFNAPEQTQFRFKMNGFENDWVPAGEHRVASYGRIPAGTYRFEVVAQNRDGTWPTQGASALLQIAPRFWETNWFRGLAIAGIFTLAVLFWMQRLARRRALNSLREQITRDLHDDLGSNLGSIALLSEALRRSSARSNTEELLLEINRIARETLDSMRDMLWFVDPGRDDLADLIQRLRQLAQSVLKGIEHEFHGPARTAHAGISLELKRSVVLIYKEALHNVLRHSGATHADIYISFEKGLFSFEIADNGCGFDASAARDGHGLNNMKHRAKSVGGMLELRTLAEQGTRVIFKVKLVDVA